MVLASVRSTMVRVAVLGAVVLAISGSASAASAPLNHLDNADLLDLLDADLDEDFLTNNFRNLQQDELTGAPTPAPTPGDREIDIATSAPTAADGITTSPTTAGVVTEAPVSTVSGAMSRRPSSAAMAVVAVVMAATAAVLA